MTHCSAEDLQMSSVGFVTLVDAFNTTKKCRSDSIYLATKTKKLGSNTEQCVQYTEVVYTVCIKLHIRKSRLDYNYT